MRRVNVYVDQPSCIEMHVRENVRLDRLTPTEADGYVAEQYGALLTPGVTQVQMEAGIYHLRTLDDAQLRVISGGVQVSSANLAADKDPWPDPPPNASAVGESVASKGYGPCGRVPALSVEYEADVMP